MVPSGWIVPGRGRQGQRQLRPRKDSLVGGYHVQGPLRLPGDVHLKMEWVGGVMVRGGKELGDYDSNKN